jgi:hypothetical protein
MTTTLTIHAVDSVETRRSRIDGDCFVLDLCFRRSSREDVIVTVFSDKRLRLDSKGKRC